MDLMLLFGGDGNVLSLDSTLMVMQLNILKTSEFYTLKA